MVYGDKNLCLACGKEYVYKNCGACNKTICGSCAVNLRRFKVKRTMLEYKGGKCQICGFDKYLASLAFHHTANDKSFEISGDHSRSWENIRKELDKCVLLCQNCHAEEHERIDIIRRKDDQDSNRVCATCGKHYKYFRGNSKGHMASMCNSCLSHIKRAKFKKKAVEYKGEKCEWCGYNKNACALTFHHIEPSKKEFSLSGMKSKSWASVEKELDKCLLLCFNCHQELHARESKYYKFYYGELADPGSTVKLYRKTEIKEYVPRTGICPVCNKSFTGDGKYCSHECAHFAQRKVIRPSKEELENLLKEHSCRAVGKMFGVSDKCICKWLKVYNKN